MTMGSSIQAMTFTGPLHFSHAVISMPNTRLSRLAQVIAMDGMYVGFAGAKTDHGARCYRCAFLGHKVHGTDLALACPLAAFGRGYPDTVVAVGREHTVEAGQVHPGFGHQGRQLRDGRSCASMRPRHTVHPVHKIHPPENHMGEPLAAQVPQLLSFMRLYRHAGV